MARLETLNGSAGGRPVVICDLDSTLYNTAHRHHLAPTDPEVRHTVAGWNAYSLACDGDTVIPGTRQLLRLAAGAGALITILSARGHVAYEATKYRLREDGVPFHYLILRRDSEEADNLAFKQRIIRDIRLEWQVSLLIDDDAATCAWALEAGIPTLHVHQPQEYECGLPL